MQPTPLPTANTRTTCGFFQAAPHLNQDGHMSNPPDCLDPGDPVFTGPFHNLPPLDLWQQLATSHNGELRPGEEIRASAQAWLRTVLEEAHIELGEYDQVVIAVLAQDCITTVQVVGGWVSRAHSMP